MLSGKNKGWIIMKTNTWTDKYENFYLKSICKSTPELLLSIESSLYGQSWTMNEKRHADAMWRLYSKYPGNKEESYDKLKNISVKINTKVSKLFNAINAVSYKATAYIGQVKYKSKNEIVEWVKNPTSNAVVDSLFIKKDAFRYERESRIIIMTNSSRKRERMIRLKINPLDLIDSYVLDPRLTDTQYSIIKNELIKRGIKESKISQSKVYEFDL